jgi:phage shock protein PspC (stress-responsive transcriptional regulator)
MHRVIDIDLDSHPTPFRVHDDAYDALTRYLDHARTRLADDPDAAEVTSDLERSIAAKLSDRIGPAGRIVTLADIDAVLADVGPVGEDEPGPTAPPVFSDRPHRRRRLSRIREGQQFAGVCSGLAAYTEIRVDWVRTIFVLATIATAGAFMIVYLVLAFVLPIVPTEEAWLAAQD